MTFYPDISHYHPVSDWGAVKDHCPFLITKATQGVSFVDPYLATAIRECEARGIPYWLYTYLNAGGETAQAQYMVSICQQMIGSHFVGYVLDVEAGNDPGGVKAALDWLKGVSPKVMLYTGYKDFERYRWVIESRGDTVAWWEARYANGPNLHDKYHVGVDLQQYTDCGSCPGIPGGIDLNYIRGKSEDWYLEREDDMSAQDVWNYPIGYDGKVGEKDAEAWKRLGWINEHVDKIDAYLTKQEDVVGDGFSGDLYTRIAYMDKRIREISANNSALTEAVKTLAAAQGADPEKIAQMVAEAVKAKLDSLQITMSAKTEQ